MCRGHAPPSLAEISQCEFGRHVRIVCPGHDLTSCCVGRLVFRDFPELQVGKGKKRLFLPSHNSYPTVKRWLRSSDVRKNPEISATFFLRSDEARGCRKLHEFWSSLNRLTNVVCSATLRNLSLTRRGIKASKIPLICLAY